MRARHQANCFQGGLGSISGLVVFFDREVAAGPGKEPELTRYALLITPKGQSVRKRRTRRKEQEFEIEIRAEPAGGACPPRRRRDLN
jgi:hypothetical protein